MRSHFALLVLTISCSAIINHAQAKVIALGDSTMSACRSAPLNTNTGGWGTALESFLNVPLINLARSGDSIRSASRDGIIKQGLTQATRGDYVLIQYGRNDKHVGTGKETCDAPQPSTGKTCKGSTAAEATVFTFIDWTTQVAKQFKAKGVEVIIVSVTTINPYRSGVATFTAENNPFVAQAKQAAGNAGVAFIDMHASMTSALKSQTAAQVKKYYVGSSSNTNDVTHLTPLGAQIAAKQFIAALTASTSTLKQHITSTPGQVRQLKCPA